MSLFIVKPFIIIIFIVSIVYMFSIIFFDKEVEVVKEGLIPNAGNAIQNRTESQVRLIYSYGDLEAHLCNKIPDWTKKTIYNSSKNSCPQHGIVTVGLGGRTGNKLWQYASIWAIARHTGLRPYIPACTKSDLSKMFENLTLPTFQSISHCPIELNTYLESVNEWRSFDQNIILPPFNFQFKLVLSQPVQDIRHEFRFKKSFTYKAQDILKEFVKTMPVPKEYTFVGVHVRRSDYISYIKRKYKMKPVGAQYFKNAMNYYRPKYPNCLFIYISDDPNWCYNNFGYLTDVVVHSYGSKRNKSSPEEDLALMAACNHSIIDYGTFGEWGAILAGGDTVLSNTTINYGQKTGKFLQNWIMMS